MLDYYIFTSHLYSVPRELSVNMVYFFFLEFNVFLVSLYKYSYIIDMIS